MDPTQKGGKWEQVCESAGGEERAAEGESQRHEERESSSNRPELAAFVMAWRQRPGGTYQDVPPGRCLHELHARLLRDLYLVHRHEHVHLLVVDSTVCHWSLERNFEKNYCPNP